MNLDGDKKLSSFPAGCWRSQGGGGTPPALPTPAMESSIENLLALQKLARPGRPLTSEQQAARVALREKTPAPILAHFDRLLACGRTGAAMVRHGVCGGCHMKVPIGMAASLAKPNDLNLCENCGCYLVLAPDEGVDEPQPPIPAPVRKTRPQRQMVAV